MWAASKLLAYASAETRTRPQMRGQQEEVNAESAQHPHSQTNKGCSSRLIAFDSAERQQNGSWELKRGLASFMLTSHSTYKGRLQSTAWSSSAEHRQLLRFRKPTAEQGNDHHCQHCCSNAMITSEAPSQRPCPGRAATGSPTGTCSPCSRAARPAQSQERLQLDFYPRAPQNSNNNLKVQEGTPPTWNLMRQAGYEVPRLCQGGADVEWQTRERCRFAWPSMAVLL